MNTLGNMVYTSQHRNMLMLLAMLIVCFLGWGNMIVAQTNTITIDLSKPPWENPLIGTWENNGWIHDPLAKCIRSGNIKDGQTCRITFSIDIPTYIGSKGNITFTAVASSEDTDRLYFFVNNRVQCQLSGETRHTFSFPLTPGPNQLTWWYSKDSSWNVRRDCVEIYNITLTYPMFLDSSCVITDNDSPLSSGNGDGIVQNFEIVNISGKIANSAGVKPEDITLAIENSPTLWVVYDCTISAAEDQCLQYSVSIMANQKDDKPTITVPFVLKTWRGTPIYYSFGTLKLPYQKPDNSKYYLEKKHPIQTKKFDYTSKQDLDQFLRLFPTSDFAPALFRLRLECCRRVRNQKLEENKVSGLLSQKKLQNLLTAINEYHEFIEKYPDKVLTKIAIQECFELHVHANRISLYHNFVERYPYAEQSSVAFEHIKALLFAVVCTENSIFGYEKFMEMYPEDAFYRTKCIQLAIENALQAEQALWTTEESQKLDELLLFKRRSVRSNLLIQELSKIRKEYKDLPAGERFAKAASDTRIQRIKRVITDIYPDTNAMGVIAVLDDLQDIADLNQGIKTYLDQKIQQVDQDMDKNFRAVQTRFDQVQENLIQIRRDIQDVKTGIANLQTSVNKLHQDLLTCHKDVMQRFDKVDDNIRTIDTHIQQGFATVNEKLDSGFSQINTRLQVLHSDLTQINTNILKMDVGITNLQENNKQFLLQNAQILQTLQENGKIYTGYESCPKSSACTIVGGMVGNILTVGVSQIPTVGPVLAPVVAPACTWLGKKIAGGVADLWNEIF